MDQTDYEGRISLAQSQENPENDTALNNSKDGEPASRKEEEATVPSAHRTDMRASARIRRDRTDLAERRRQRTLNRSNKQQDTAPEEDKEVEMKDEYDVDLDQIISEANKLQERKQLKRKNSGRSASGTNNTVSAEPEVLLEQGNSSYFEVSSLPPKLPLIDGKSFTPRYMEQEGFYVGTKPITDRTYILNRNRMEQRLLKESPTNVNWFGEDGHINNEPTPLKILYERPARLFDPTLEYLQTRFIEPSTGASLSTVTTASLPEKLFQLEIDVQYVKFYDHPLFSKENILAAQLELLDLEYKERQKSNLSVFYAEKLQALENHLEYLKKHPQQPSTAREANQPRVKQVIRRTSSLKSLSEETTSTLEKLTKLWEVIKQTRILRDVEDHNDIAIVKKMVAIWNQLKELRESQGFTSTPLQLLIKKIPSDMNEDLANLERQLDSEMKEMKEDHHTAFAEQIETYRRQLKEYEQTKQTDNPPQDSEAAPAPTMPEWRDFDEKAARQSLLERYKKTKRKPGNPILIPILSNNNAHDITPTESCPVPEQHRRSEIAKTQLYIKLTANNRLVTKTQPRNLNIEFEVEIGELFTLQLVRWPDTIRAQLLASQSQGFGMTKEITLGEITLKVPVKESKHAPERFPFDISNSMMFVPRWEADSITTNDVPMPPEHDNLHQVTGALWATIGWTHDEQNRSLQPPVPMSVKAKALTEDVEPAFNVTSTLKLREWLNSQAVDPNDPRNFNVQQFVKKGSTESASDAGMLENELMLVDPKDASKSSTRYELLKLRQANKLPKQVIPLLESEVKRVSFELPSAADTDTVVPAVMEQSKNEFLQEVRAAQVKQIIAAKANPSLQLSDVLKPMQMQEFNILEVLQSLLRVKRKLRPERKERPTVTLLAVKECQIVVQIVRGFNIPSRNHFGQAGKNDHHEEDVAPFVEVCFQAHCERTHSAFGASPQWHETIQFPFQPPGNDFSANNLQVIADHVHINLFDELTVDIPKDNRNKDEIHQRRERRWLGSLSIPFNAIYRNKEITGTFKIRKPVVSLSHHMGTSRSVNDLGVASTSDTLLSLYVTLNPPLQPPEPPKVEEHHTHEDADTIHYALSWIREIKMLKQFQKRRIQALATDLLGKSAVICRYIKPQNPPKVEAIDPTVIRELHRFVSMIPFLEDSVTFVGRSNLWNTSQQFLDMRAGDWEEHAILLCNYLLFLKKECWVALGTGIEGEISYVMVKEDGKYVFYNACTGDHYDQTDTLCPLKDIGCIFNESNVWANIQVNGDPSRIHFNLSDASAWRPLFTPRFPMKAAESLQVEQLEYSIGATDSDVAKTMEADIETAITDNIAKWRKRFPFRMNRNCSKILKGLLARCESDGLGRSHFTEEENEKELVKLRISYNIHGFPLNMAYTDVQHIVDAVFQASIHKTDDPKAEFAVASCVTPYPNRVFSVWVYVAVLVPH